MVCFFDGGPWHRLWEKVLIPGVASDGWQDIGESDQRLADQVTLNRFSVSPGQMIEPVNDQCVETEQARFNSQYCIVESSPRSLQRQVVSDCLKNVASIIPATNERFDDASDAHANMSTEGSTHLEVCRQITGVTPAHRDAHLVWSSPVPRTGNDLDSSCSAAVLFLCQSLTITA